MVVVVDRYFRSNYIIKGFTVFCEKWRETIMGSKNFVLQKIHKKINDV